jgi:copper homeostasis protein
MRRRLEICLTDFASAQAAREGGADRVELCADLASGGITPSAGMIARVASMVGIETHVLIRPRGGDFVYDHDETAIMLEDIDYVKSTGGAGVVIGALRDDGRIDRETSARLIERARPLHVTFHKAIDCTPCPLVTLDHLISLGVDRVLTSGGPGPCRDNLASLRRMVEHAAGRIVIMAGGGIRAEDLPELIDAGLSDFHLGSGVTGASPVAEAFGSRPARVETDRVRTIVDLLGRHEAVGDV